MAKRCTLGLDASDAVAVFSEGGVGASDGHCDLFGLWRVAADSQASGVGFFVLHGPQGAEALGVGASFR